MFSGPFGYPFQAPMQQAAGLVGEEPATVESSKSPEENLREKKSTIMNPTDLQEAMQAGATIFTNILKFWDNFYKQIKILGKFLQTD